VGNLRGHAFPARKPDGKDIWLAEQARYPPLLVKVARKISYANKQYALI
jgi:hypothetical protein